MNNYRGTPEVVTDYCSFIVRFLLPVRRPSHILRRCTLPFKARITSFRWSIRSSRSKLQLACLYTICLKKGRLYKEADLDPVSYVGKKWQQMTSTSSNINQKPNGIQDGRCSESFFEKACRSPARYLVGLYQHQGNLPVPIDLRLTSFPELSFLCCPTTKNQITLIFFRALNIDRSLGRTS